MSNDNPGCNRCGKWHDGKVGCENANSWSLELCDECATMTNHDAGCLRCREVNSPEKSVSSTIRHDVAVRKVKEIPFNREYKVSNDGVVYSKRFDRPLTSHIDKNGYLKVVLAVPGTERFESKSKNYRVHRLVAATFLMNPKNHKIINHLNNQRDDNRVENLEWSTQLNNIHHILRRNIACPSCDHTFNPGLERKL